MADLPHPRRGEAWWVAFDPSVGGEIHKTCPAIILGNDAANAALNRVQVVTITPGGSVAVGLANRRKRSRRLGVSEQSANPSQRCQMHVGVAEQHVDHRHALEVVADIVFHGHADAAVQLDRFLADMLA